jgi:hypothetical protein
VLCPNPSAGVGEHVWPAWLIGDFHGEGPFHTEKSGTPYKKRDNTTVAKFAALPSVHVPMCANCNARLNTKVEEPAKPVVRRVLPRSSTHAWPTLTADEAAALGRWFLKVGLLLSHPEAVDDNPHTAQDLAAARFDEFCQDWVAWMAAGADPQTTSRCTSHVAASWVNSRGLGTWPCSRCQVESMWPHRNSGS